MYENPIREVYPAQRPSPGVFRAALQVESLLQETVAQGSRTTKPRNLLVGQSGTIQGGGTMAQEYRTVLVSK